MHGYTHDIPVYLPLPLAEMVRVRARDVAP